MAFRCRSYWRSDVGAVGVQFNKSCRRSVLGAFDDQLQQRVAVTIHALLTLRVLRGYMTRWVARQTVSPSRGRQCMWDELRHETGGLSARDWRTFRTRLADCPPPWRSMGRDVVPPGQSMGRDVVPPGQSVGRRSRGSVPEAVHPRTALNGCWRYLRYRVSQS